MNNISTVKDCYGCGVCAITCPKKIISIRLNENGFYVPYLIDKRKCIDCGLCLNVCAYVKDEIAPLPSFDIKSYAAWSKDKQIRYDSSSGGISFELGKYLIKQGYKACGVKYDISNRRAEHFIATTVEGFLPSIGSKYIPSYTFDGFSQFTRKDKFFVVGTPCQIDSLRHYVRLMKIEDNFVLMDFFCHGVPSMLMWNKYLSSVERKLGINIDNICWRNKKTGWHDSYVIGVLNKSKSKTDFDYYSLMSKGDLFYKFFLGNKCLGKACYDKCKYKMLSSAADIRIGDLWGTVYQEDEDGVSGVVVFTDRGLTILNGLVETVYLRKEQHSIVLEGQMKQAAKRPADYDWVSEQLKKGSSLEWIDLLILVRYVLTNFPRIMRNRINRIFK